MNWRAVSAVIMPEAAISGRHEDPAAQVSCDPSAYNVKCIGDELSALPLTGSSERERVAVPPISSENASARHTAASVLDNERDNLYSRS